VNTIDISEYDPLDDQEELRAWAYQEGDSEEEGSVIDDGEQQ